MFSIGLTDHLEGPRGQPSGEVFAEVADLVQLADELGVRYAWFAEHHAHAHRGHLPSPLLFALHLAGRTREIQLGSAIICLNLHHPLDVAEQVAVADLLAGGRIAAGFGSGSTPEESAMFGFGEGSESDRHVRFESALRQMRSIWSAATACPRPRPDLASRCWVAVNSPGAARIAGALNFNVMFSHLRTAERYREYRAQYTAAGGTRLIAANRPIFVGPDDAAAIALAEPALRVLWRRFRDEGKIAAHVAEPPSAADLCAHPINFIVGGPDSVARQLLELHRECLFDVANVEVRWPGLSHADIRASLQRLMTNVVPLLSARHQSL